MSSKLTINWRGLEAAINTAIAKQQNVYLPKGKKEFIVLAAEQATEADCPVWTYDFLPEDIVGLDLLCREFAAASALITGLMAFEKLEAWANTPALVTEPQPKATGQGCHSDEVVNGRIFFDKGSFSYGFRH